jgi:cephalosporin hydroxylase
LIVLLVSLVLPGCNPAEVEPQEPKAPVAEAKPAARGPSDVQKSTERASNLVTQFRRFYHFRVGKPSHFMGVHIRQYPTDNWVMVEILTELAPDYVIETGTLNGGSALFYAAILEQVNPNGRIITIDIDSSKSERARKMDLWKRRIDFIHASSVDPDVVSRIAQQVRGSKVLVTFDSDHSKDHVLKEMQALGPLVTPGSYMIVQDTVFNGHPIHQQSFAGGGPWAAVEEFMKTSTDFEIDKTRERYVITSNPSGYLKKIR